MAVRRMGRPPPRTSGGKHGEVIRPNFARREWKKKEEGKNKKEAFGSRGDRAKFPPLGGIAQGPEK